MARHDPTATFREDDPAGRVTVDAPSAGAQDDSGSGGGVRIDAATTGEVAALAVQPQDRYVSHGVIGQGGMGTVLVVQDRIIGRRVALKQLIADRADDPASRSRFNREALLQGQLEHPAIVPVYDVGMDGHGNPFFTMRRVRGQPLDEVLGTMALARRASQGGTATGKGIAARFTRRKLLTAFSQLCLAVHYAHEHGVVHRDIKPSNIMLGHYGEVYLLDWGIAKVETEVAPKRPSWDEIATPTAPPTGRGAVIGSLVTMAPEQALGAEVDARSDIYALGAVLFEILTFESLHPPGLFADVVKQIVLGIESRPSIRCPSADVPPELEAIVVRATKLHPDDRYPTALELHEALEGFLEGDRDQQLRREGAARHATAARQAADEALGTAAPALAEEARARALQEVGKALALDPENATALATFVSLLTTPPMELPREVREEDDAGLRKRQRIGGIAAAGLYGYITVNALFTWYLGVRDVRIFTLCHVGWALAMGLSVLAAVRPSYKTLFAVLVTGLLTSVYVTTVYGPFLIVPTLLGVHAALFALVRDWPLRIAGLALTTLGWTVSVFGERLGLFPTVVTYAGGDLSMRSPVVELPAGATTFFMYSAVLTSILAPSLVIGALRSSSAKNELAARLQAWQLRKLVSREAQDAVPPTDGTRVVSRRPPQP